MYDLIQVLKRLTSAHALKVFITEFPNYFLFNKKVREAYFSGLENRQILEGVLSGDILAKEVWNQRYYPLKEPVGSRNPVHQAFKGNGDIVQILEKGSIPENIRETIMGHYNDYMRIEDFISGRHIPTLDLFYRNIHGEQAPKREQIEEQINEYSIRN